MSDALSDEREQPAQPRTAVADVIREESPSDGQQQTVAFGLDGQTYEIDLDPEDAGELRSALQRYINAGRRIGEQPARPAVAGSARPRRAGSMTQRNDTAAVRAWAQAHGHPVSDRGRIPATVLQAYQATQHGSPRAG